MYQSLEVAENEEDNAVDTAGYTGIFRRQDDKHLYMLSTDEFVDVFQKENKLSDVMRLIFTIDHDHNGYITSTEMDDILKITYPKELSDKNLKKVFQMFRSSANKVLLDYKQFRDFIL